MNIYAIKDRLLNYYMQPFAAPEDKAVMSALAKTVNNGGVDAITQAPHHYEIWRLASVDEEGRITANREFLADCSSLIRAGLRKDAAWEPGAIQAGKFAQGLQRPAGEIARPEAPHNSSAGHPTRPATEAGAETQLRDPGSPAPTG